MNLSRAHPYAQAFGQEAMNWLLWIGLICFVFDIANILENNIKNHVKNMSVNYLILGPKISPKKSISMLNSDQFFFSLFFVTQRKFVPKWKNHPKIKPIIIIFFIIRTLLKSFLDYS